MGRPSIEENILKVFKTTKGLLTVNQIMSILDKHYALKFLSNTISWRLILMTRKGFLVRQPIKLANGNLGYCYELRKKSK